MTRPGKPAGLLTGAYTAENKEKRAKNEASLTPQRGLTVHPPVRLKDQKVASATWRQAMRTYQELQAVIVTRLDLDELADYCLLMQHAYEIGEMRQSMVQTWMAVNAHWAEIIADKSGEDLLVVSEKLQNMQEAIAKLDARLERKMALLKNYRESLYLTPRARAATAPSKKEKEAVPDELEQLLDDVNVFVNGDKGNG